MWWTVLFIICLILIVAQVLKGRDRYHNRPVEHRVTHTFKDPMPDWLSRIRPAAEPSREHSQASPREAINKLTAEAVFTTAETACKSLELIADQTVRQALAASSEIAKVTDQFRKATDQLINAMQAHSEQSERITAYAAALDKELKDLAR